MRAMVRSGVIAQKVGMSALFKDDGGRIPVTLMRVSGCRVVAHSMDKEKDYYALQVAGGGSKKWATKPLAGHYAKAGMKPLRKLATFRVDENAMVPIGAEFLPSHFQVGGLVDVIGTTIGRGFAGVVKRYKFAGGRASHGCSVSHRTPGSTGQRKSPGKVWKNKKMPGHYGCERVTVQNLEVVFVDDEKGVIAVKGSVPGHEDSLLLVRDAIKGKTDIAASVFVEHEALPTSELVLQSRRKRRMSMGGGKGVSVSQKERRQEGRRLAKKVATESEGKEAEVQEVSSEKVENSAEKKEGQE